MPTMMMTHVHIMVDEWGAKEERQGKEHDLSLCLFTFILLKECLLKVGHNPFNSEEPEALINPFTP